MNRPLRLATFAVPLSGNKGSASMLIGLRDAFARAGVDAHFAVFSYYPERDAEVARGMGLENVSVHPGHPKHIAFQLLPMIALSKALPFLVPASWREHVRALREADLVLLVGGTTFADSMLYKVPWNVLAALPGYWLRRPTVFLSQTMGPFRSRINRACARWTLGRAVEVHGRGRTSADLVRSIGIDRVRYEPDLSFPMLVPDFDEVAGRVPLVASLRDRIGLARAEGRRIVGVTPNSIVHAKAKKAGRDYIAFLTSAIATIRDRGHLPVLVPHSYRDDVSRLHNNDRALCLRVMEQQPDPSSCVYVDQDLSSQDLRAIIGQFDLLVASRFHSMVSALAMGVPPLTFGWGHQKYLEVLAEFGVEDLYVSYEDLDPARFTAKFDEALLHQERHASRIAEAVGGIVSQANALPGLLLALGGEPGVRPPEDRKVEASHFA